MPSDQAHHFLSTFLPLAASSPFTAPGIHFQVQAVGGTCCFRSRFLPVPGDTKDDLSEVCVWLPGREHVCVWGGLLSALGVGKWGGDLS